jgi:site-specific recombinase XerD
MKSAAPDPLSRLIQAFFCERLQTQRQVSPCTVAGYRDTFRLLLKFVQRETNRAPDRQRLQDLDAPLILRFLDHLEKERRNSPRTRNARLAAIRSFMHYVAFQEPAAVAMTTRVLAIPTKRYNRPLLECLSREEMQAILEAPTSSSWSGQRDRVLLRLLYNTGARVSEIVALSRADIQLGTPCLVRLHGKGRKDRAVPVWKSTARELRLWLKYVPSEPGTPLFANRFGQRLSRSGIGKRLRLTVRAAIPHCDSLRSRAVSPHTFRHTTAMHLLQNGVDITVIALWLGHESPATTHHYVELDMELKRRALEKLAAPNTKACRFHPSDALLAFLESL